MFEQSSSGIRRYFDNAATSFPKPPEVMQAMSEYAHELGASPGRGAYREVGRTTELLTRCRHRLGSLLGCPSPDHVIFTLNTTDALSMAINGIVTRRLLDGHRAHLVTSDLDHNSVLRPFRLLAERNPGRVTVTRIPCDPDTGRITPDDVRQAIGVDTALVALAHASNATGTIQPIKGIGEVCRACGVPFLVDGAQTAGHRELDMQECSIDLLAVPGHKGLLGPLGTGALLMRPGIEQHVAPIRVGGTGSISETDRHPDSMPDRYEAGSHNAIGLVGLDAALGWIEKRTLAALIAHEKMLAADMLEGLLAIEDVHLLGPADEELRCGVFSFVHRTLEPDELAGRLESEHGLLVRSGLHCAPFAHKTFGTDPRTAALHGRMPGACRMSLGPFLQPEDVHEALEALASLGTSRVKIPVEGALAT
ncbi:MAG: aminotransferase class V-fold PLP-dependent enzyme [Phycisphaerales bacterium]|nr:aminotransferase class V-fold PLP-dependent enzyme [Phycisphaerales bacterium]